MSLLERYKKTGGFVQLLGLLETCTPQKRDKFLNMIKEESVAWELALRPRILTVERIFTWSSVILTEILTRLQTINVAILYSNFDEDRRNQMSSVLNFNLHAQVKQIVKEKKFTLSEVNISMEKFLIETRSLINQGIIKLDRIDPELDVPVNIEDKLNASLTTKPVTVAAPSAPVQDMVFKPSPAVPLTRIVTLSEAKVAEIGYDGEDLSMPLRPPSLDGLLVKQEVALNTELHIEISKLKEKIQFLEQENLMCKQEIMALNDKLERIRKIA
jgi:hypothetical protein